MCEPKRIIEGLPLLPGNTFKDPTHVNHHLTSTMGIKNGFKTIKAYPEVGIGGRPLNVVQISENELNELANFQPSLTYGKAKQAPPSQFIPAHVALDKKVLRFYGYFKETINESPEETYRTRYVSIMYYLEDDSMSIFEPKKNNCGLPQGVLINRHRFPKNDIGDTYNWRDLNLGMNLALYGRVYRITNCDGFTKNFLTSEGVILNETEQEPEDPYLTARERREVIPLSKTKSSYDKMRQFLELDRKVLRFYAVKDERKEPFGEFRKFVIHYYLCDDTMEIAETRAPNDGHDPFPIFLRRGKIPKNLDHVPSTFPLIAMEPDEEDIRVYFTPKDFSIGHSVNVFGNQFFIHDCDNFTKAWYHENYGMTEFEPIDITLKYPKPRETDIPPYNGYGTLEDSLNSVRTFMPKPPKTDLAKQCDYGVKSLRYELQLDTMKSDDASRRFILSYYLANDTISIYEKQVRNSGFLGGPLLKRIRVLKPGSSIDKPSYYGPSDFAVNQKIIIFGKRFVIKGMDKFVLSFLEANKNQFSPELIKSVRDHIEKCEKINTVTVQEPLKTLRLVEETSLQLKKLGYTCRLRLHELFLDFDKNRNGYVDLDSLKAMCDKLSLPINDNVLTAILEKHGTDGKMNLEQFTDFFN